ncbi:uncharacterized protein [Ambystoma mexicanum]|uniref:uncharacterized protein n=1 Tax=Ambystoma mexicanum TaxID=8296 RepID=UPI0037E8D55B
MKMATKVSGIPLPGRQTLQHTEDSALDKKASCEETYFKFDQLAFLVSYSVTGILLPALTLFQDWMTNKHGQSDSGLNLDSAKDTDAQKTDPPTQSLALENTNSAIELSVTESVSDALATDALPVSHSTSAGFPSGYIVRELTNRGCGNISNDNVSGKAQSGERSTMRSEKSPTSHSSLSSALVKYEAMPQSPWNSASGHECGFPKLTVNLANRASNQLVTTHFRACLSFLNFTAQTSGRDQLVSLCLNADSVQIALDQRWSLREVSPLRSSNAHFVTKSMACLQYSQMFIEIEIVLLNNILRMSVKYILNRNLTQALISASLTYTLGGKRDLELTSQQWPACIPPRNTINAAKALRKPTSSLAAMKIRDLLTVPCLTLMETEHVTEGEPTHFTPLGVSLVMPPIEAERSGKGTTTLSGKKLNSNQSVRPKITNTTYAVKKSKEPQAAALNTQNENQDSKPTAELTLSENIGDHTDYYVATTLKTELNGPPSSLKVQSHQFKDGNNQGISSIQNTYENDCEDESSGGSQLLLLTDAIFNQTKLGDIVIDLANAIFPPALNATISLNSRNLITLDSKILACKLMGRIKKELWDTMHGKFELWLYERADVKGVVQVVFRDVLIEYNSLSELQSAINREDEFVVQYIANMVILELVCKGPEAYLSEKSLLYTETSSDSEVERSGKGTTTCGGKKLNINQSVRPTITNTTYAVKKSKEPQAAALNAQNENQDSKPTAELTPSENIGDHTDYYVATALKRELNGPPSSLKVQSDQVIDGNNQGISNIENTNENDCEDESSGGSQLLLLKDAIFNQTKLGDIVIDLANAIFPPALSSTISLNSRNLMTLDSKILACKLMGGIKKELWDTMHGKFELWLYERADVKGVVQVVFRDVLIEYNSLSELQSAINRENECVVQYIANMVIIELICKGPKAYLSEKSSLYTDTSSDSEVERSGKGTSTCGGEKLHSNQSVRPKITNTTYAVEKSKEPQAAALNAQNENQDSKPTAELTPSEKNGDHTDYYVATTLKRELHGPPSPLKVQSDQVIDGNNQEISNIENTYEKNCEDESSGGSQLLLLNDAIFNQTKLGDIVIDLANAIFPPALSSTISLNSRNLMTLDSKILACKLMGGIKKELGDTMHGKFELWLYERADVKGVVQVVFRDVLIEYNSLSELQSAINGEDEFAVQYIANLVILELICKGPQAYLSEKSSLHTESSSDSEDEETPSLATKVDCQDLNIYSAELLESILCQLVSRICTSCGCPMQGKQYEESLSEILLTLFKSISLCLAERHIVIVSNMEVIDCFTSIDNDGVNSVVDTVFNSLLEHYGSNSEVYKNFTEANTMFVKVFIDLIIDKISSTLTFERNSVKEVALASPAALQTDFMILKILMDVRKGKTHFQSTSVHSVGIWLEFYLPKIVSSILHQLVNIGPFPECQTNVSEDECAQLAHLLRHKIMKLITSGSTWIINRSILITRLYDERHFAAVASEVSLQLLQFVSTPEAAVEALATRKEFALDVLAKAIISDINLPPLQPAVPGKELHPPTQPASQPDPEPSHEPEPAPSHGPNKWFHSVWKRMRHQGRNGVRLGQQKGTFSGFEETSASNHTFQSPPDSATSASECQIEGWRFKTSPAERDRSISIRKRITSAFSKLCSCRRPSRNADIDLN